MMDILLTGFCGTSSELLVKMARHKSIILPNNKVADSQLLIEEIGPRNYDYIFSFGQKPRIKDKICLETVAGNKTNRILTNFKYSRLKRSLRKIIYLFGFQIMPVLLSVTHCIGTGLIISTIIV